LSRIASVLKPVTTRGPNPVKLWLAVCVAITLVLGLILTARRCGNPEQFLSSSRLTESKKIKRELPAHFPLDTHLPPCRETKASGAINPNTFSAGDDLIRFDDERVWWESDHVRNGDENDHIINRAMKVPLEKLIESVYQLGGSLKIQDAYQPAGEHGRTSLHKEGRAIDLTCTDMSLETLAKLCWLAGFDWVYYEAKGGAHVHCSVRTLRNR
jgi:hypothetical protein